MRLHTLLVSIMAFMIFREMKFRDGKPEDYISMTCGYDFKHEYSENKQDLETFLKVIQPEMDFFPSFFICYIR